jgi:hypothetical protein
MDLDGHQQLEQVGVLLPVADLMGAGGAEIHAVEVVAVDRPAEAFRADRDVAAPGLPGEPADPDLRVLFAVGTASVDHEACSSRYLGADLAARQALM